MEADASAANCCYSDAIRFVIHAAQISKHTFSCSVNASVPARK